jgi:hypothetical protein
MKRGKIILLALCLALSGIFNWQAFSQGNTQSDLQFKPPFSSEKPIAQAVQRVKTEGEAFPITHLFEQQASSVSKITKLRFAEVETLQRAVDDGAILALNRGEVQNLLERGLEALTVSLSTATADTVELELIKADIYSPNFTVVTSSSEQAVKVEKGAHYRGVVKGVPNSIAAISVFPNEVTGFYSTQEGGNVVLGRLGGKNPEHLHILYAEKDLKAKRDSVCGTKDDHETIPLSSVLPQSFPVANKRVGIYIEADFDLFQNRGSVANVTSYVAAFFNQSATLYSNEGIPIVISQIFVWTSPSPYTGASSGAVLTQFQTFRNAFSGDLGHLVSLRSNLGGIAAGFNGFCNANIDNRQCFSGVDPTFNNVPTYSWTVEVFTHEMGHLMGSRHTHACVWNGNGTAIDSCSGFTEEGCPLPGNPAGGGTIMSYCHLTGVGINFATGFGPQPGNVIRSQYSNATCLATGVPLYRYWNGSLTDHFYTINFGTLGSGASGWNLEWIQCFVYSTQVAGTVPLYRYWNPSIGDHFYTTNFGTLGNGAFGWTFEWVECYVYSTQVAGTIPLYRYWNEQTGDHFYSADFNELGNGASGYVLEGIACYVLP